jgi:hypothetical protein
MLLLPGVLFFCGLFLFWGRMTAHREEVPELTPDP